MFKRLRDALERALEAATPPAELGQIASQMRDAVVEQKAGVRGMQEDLGKVETLLKLQQTELATAERRRELASGIGDAETVEVADKYLVKLRERIVVLERKVAVQREELALAERDLVEMTAQLQQAALKHPDVSSGRSTEAAWQGLGKAGMDRPELDLESELLKHRAERAQREATADAMLDEMKKKLGRE